MTDPSTTQPRPSRTTRSAWLALLCTPVGFITAMLVGEGMMSALGYEPGIDTPPPLQELLITVVTLPILLVAPLLAIRWGLAGRRNGESGAIFPVAIGGVVVGWMVFVTIGNAFFV